MTMIVRPERSRASPAVWRPTASQSLVFRLSGAVLDPGAGFDDLVAQMGKASRFYSVLANATLAF